MMKKKKILSLAAAIALAGSISLYGGEEGDAKWNVYYGAGAGSSLGGTGMQNVFMGYYTGCNTTAGSYNTFSGYNSGFFNTTGSYNTFSGHESGFKNETGGGNTFNGHGSGYQNTNGNYNTFSGSSSGHQNTTGYNNTFIGYGSGLWNTTGDHNVFLGSYAGFFETGSNKLYIDSSDTSTPLIYGEFDNDLVRINGKLEGTWAGSDTANNHNIVALSSANDSANSDVGFSLENTQDGHNGSYKWAFRTYEPSEGLSMTKIGTGGTEFLIENLGDDLTTTKLYAGGHVIFEDGHIVTASSRSLKTDIKPLDSQAALDAFHKLQPVSYVYKAHKGEPVVGFIAEDVPELVAMPSRKSFDSAEIVAVLTSVLADTRAELKAKDERMVAMEVEMKEMKDEITKFKVMQQKVAQLESLLTNLALDTSNSEKEKISFKLK